MCEFHDLRGLEWENTHSHSYYSNIMTPDCVISRNDIAERAVELGHKTLACLEHGYGGNVFEAYGIAKEHGLKLIFGTEFYYVKDRFEKDKTNSHVLVLAKNQNGQEALNRLISEANTTGFYIKPRIDEELLFSLPKDDVLVTTACIASPVNLYDAEYAKHFIQRGKDYFGENFFLEIQPHTNHKQQDYHRKLLKFNEEFNVDLILGVDTHYIYEKDATYRDIFLRSKDINYPEEEGFIIDFPDTDTLIDRFEKQEVLTPMQVKEAFNSTLVVREFKGVNIDTDIKMMSLYPDETHEQKMKRLKSIINKAWVEDRKHIPKEQWKEYIEAIQFETKIIEDTKMEDYFLLNEKVIKRATEEYNGVLTRTGRGSAPSSYVNKLLGFTNIDRLEAPVTLYPTRFMSKSRILETRSLPDVDFNTSDPKPFVKATQDLLGEDSAYYMIAYGTMQDRDAFKTYCKGIGMMKNEYWDISEDLERWSKTEKWHNTIEESKRFIGVVKSFSPHPCAVLLLDEPIPEKIGILQTREGVKVALIDSYNSDVYKYLKNDYLAVTVWEIIAKVYEEIGMPIDSIRELNRKTKDDERVWKLYEDGIVSTLNQTGTESGRPQIMQYSPKDIRELSMWVSAIRPSFASMKAYFLNRREFTYGIETLDELLVTSDNFILFQENIMAVLQYAGFPEDETYGLLKAISKKKKGIIEPIHDRFMKGFMEQTGSEEEALRVWKVIEDAVGYGFNSSHAYAVALDSLYGAYLKANYPLEYYTVVLNIYKDKKDKQAELINELNYFGIKLQNLEFGKSRAEYSFDKETNTIYKGIGTVAYLNDSVAENLYQLGKTSNFKNNEFIELARTIIDNSYADNRQMNILIKLGYFSRFGEIPILLEVYNTMTGYQNKKPNPIFSVKHNDKPVALKYSRTLKDTTKETRITAMKDYYLKVLKNKDILPKSKLFDLLKNEIEYMGYAVTTMQDIDTNIYVAIEVNTKYTPFYTFYNLYDGTEFKCKIDKKKAYKNLDNNIVELRINVGDVVQIIETIEKPKNQLVDGKWVQNHDVMQSFLEKVKMVEKYLDN